MPADLTKDMVYRGFKLNDQNIVSNIVQGDQIGAGISGCAIDMYDDSDVDVVQHLEKRSQTDGMDANTPTLGARRIRMAGTLYAVTRALLYDSIDSLRTALNPILASNDSPLDYGYQPLYFSRPTNRNTDYPALAIPMRVLAMPHTLSLPISRDRSGGKDGDALAVTWQATMVCKDPGLMAQDPQDYLIDHAPGVASGNFVHRGSYPSPLNMLIVVGSAAGSIAVTAGGSIFTITVPASTGNRTLRVKGDQKVFTLEENSVEVPRMDLMTFSNDTTWAQVLPGTTGYSITYTTVTAAVGSHMWFWEQFA